MKQALHSSFSKALTLSVWMIFACFIFHNTTGQAQPALKFREGCVWATGLGATSIEADQWKEFLRVFTHEAFTKKLNQPIGGAYTWYGDSLSFTPSFAFVSGETYHAALGKLELTFSIPEENFTATTIETVHPQAAVLPENLLRMYITFSAPMMPGEAYEHISLLTENGKPVDKAFLVIDQELWDTERKRFTLLFDPGRVKRGIQSNVEMGSPLKASQQYQLVINPAWRDAHGNPLATGYVKSFTVSQAERTKLIISNWKIETPTAGTREELVMYLDRPMDYALALNCMMITGAKGKVNGSVMLINSSIWKFVPDQPWQEGEFTIEAYPHLEDVAGNNFNNPFDIDLSKESRGNTTQPVRQSFLIRSLPK